jgi:hypothetical protein
MCDNLFDEINIIFSKWNPIEVPTDLAKEEYKSYITRIIKVGRDYDKIKKELIIILTSDLGANYNENNVLQKSEVEKVTTEILTKLLEEAL